jgi:predicted O-linked N-acetylglucosamine transferase (SPINDLY family)
VFAEGGIASDRLEFTARVSRVEYLARYRELDLSLDPFPYNGGVSTMDSLWMGVPVITLAGRAAVDRAGVSILANVGLPELIAETTQKYTAIALELAGDLDRLALLRAGLRGRMQTSALLDGLGYAADVEAAFRRMWRQWCGNKMSETETIP